MAKFGHVITPWPNGLGPNFWWFSETSNHALYLRSVNFWPTSFLHGVIWARKMPFLQKKTFFYSASVSSASNRFRILNFVTYPMTQFHSISSKRVVGLSPISFTFRKLRVAKWYTLLSVSHMSVICQSMVVYSKISIIGSWPRKKKRKKFDALSQGGSGPWPGPKYIYVSLTF